MTRARQRSAGSSAGGGNTSAVMALRMEIAEKAIEKLAGGIEAIDKNLEALTALAATQKNAGEALGRAFEQIQEIHRAQSRLEGEYRKWFNRGVGLAGAASLFWFLIGGFVVLKAREMDIAISAVPGMQVELKRRQKIDLFILKRMGVDDVDSLVVD